MMKKTVFYTLEIISSFWRRFNNAGNGSVMLEIVQGCWQQLINPGNSLVVLGMVVH
jgi:hypothetical protein